MELRFNLKLLFLTIAGSCVCMWVWIALSIQIDVNTCRIEENTKRVQDIEILYKRSSDRWTGKDHAAFMEELQRLNPGLKLPERKK